MSTSQVETVIERPKSYVLLILYKFLAGMVEVSIGGAFGIFGNRFLQVYQNFELSHLREDPNLYVQTVERAIPFLLDHRTYIIITFFTFGLGKIIGAVGLWYEKLWAIYLMIFLGLILIPFELTDFITHPTEFKFFYMVANIVIVIYLTQFNPHIKHIREKHKRKHLGA